MKLLDGKVWDRTELLEKMRDDEFYYGYLKTAALSSSSVKKLLESPKVYHYVTKYAQKDTKGLIEGRLLHLSVLEPQKFEELRFVDVVSKNTKAYKEAKQEYGEVYTKREREETERLTDAIFRNKFAMDLLSDAEYEVPAIGNILNYPFRGKADVLGSVIVDLKTTTDVGAFERHTATKYGYDVQAFIYCNLFNKSYKEFWFLVIDKKSLDIGIFDVSEKAYYEGEKKLMFAIDRYKQFFEQGESLDDYIIRGTI